MNRRARVNLSLALLLALLATAASGCADDPVSRYYQGKTAYRTTLVGLDNYLDKPGIERETARQLKAAYETAKAAKTQADYLFQLRQDLGLDAWTTILMTALEEFARVKAEADAERGTP